MDVIAKLVELAEKCVYLTYCVVKAIARVQRNILGKIAFLLWDMAYAAETQSCCIHKIVFC